jgi:hypothetical protein
MERHKITIEIYTSYNIKQAEEELRNEIARLGYDADYYIEEVE